MGPEDASLLLLAFLLKTLYLIFLASMNDIFFVFFCLREMQLLDYLFSFFIPSLHIVDFSCYLLRS